MNELNFRKLLWEKSEEHQLTADALGGHYMIYEFNQKIDVIWMFGTTHRRIHDYIVNLSTVTEAQFIAQNDFEKLLNDGLILN